MTYDPHDDPGLKSFGESRKQITIGDDCPNVDCDGTARHSNDKDEGQFITRSTKCDACGDWWKYDVDTNGNPL